VKILQFVITRTVSVLFARDSLLISAFTIVFSVMLKSMVENKKAAPEWITKVVCVLVAFKPGQIVFLNDASFKVKRDTYRW
jgi:hypothetical protein